MFTSIRALGTICAYAVTNTLKVIFLSDGIRSCLTHIRVELDCGHLLRNWPGLSFPKIYLILKSSLSLSLQKNKDNLGSAVGSFQGNLASDKWLPVCG